MSIIDWVVSVFLALLFVLTVIAQFRQSWVDRIRQRDLLNFLPAWYFFSPRPVTYHLFLLFRDEYEDGTITGWKKVAFSERRKWWHFIWNPGKRLNKSFFDIFKDLMDHIKISDEGEFLIGSLPYLLLLDYVSRMEHAPMSVRTQFAVFKNEAGSSESDLLFLSFVHDLDATEETAKKLLVYA